VVAGDRDGLIDRVPTAAGVDVGDPAIDQSGDHDGHTVSLAALRAMGAAPSSSAGAATGPQVHAVRCPAGHINSQNASTCRRCRAVIVDRSVQLLPRPSLGQLRFADGMVVELDRTLYLGRNPKAATQVPDGVGVVSIPDPEKALSRLHTEVRLEDWHVYVVDRRSANGTTVQLPGEKAVLLRAEEPMLIVPGAQIDLGVAWFQYEVTP
jgi:hypothetical protein